MDMRHKSNYHFKGEKIMTAEERQTLFEHMNHEHDVTLLESDMDAISNIVNKGQEERIKKLEKDRDFWMKDRNDLNNMFTERLNKLVGALRIIRGVSLDPNVKSIANKALNTK